MSRKSKRRPPNLSGLRVRALEERDAEAFARTFEQAYGTPLGGTDGARHFAWQYTQVPERHLWIQIAEPTDADVAADTPIAAAYGIIPRRLSDRGVEHTGALSLDTLTMPDFRRRGLFVHLATVCYQRAKEEGGVTLVYGFPNENSAPGLEKRLGWRMVGTVQKLVAVPAASWLLGRAAKPRREIKRRGAIYRTGLPAEFGPRDDALWARTAPDRDLCAVRDAAYLDWRYTKPPFATSQRHEVVDAQGELIGLVVTRLSEYRGLRRAHIMEAIAPRARRGELARLLRYAVRHLARHGALVVQAIANPGMSTYLPLLRAGFAPIPQRMSPGPLLGYVPLDPQHPATVRPWEISYGDCDTV